MPTLLSSPGNGSLISTVLAVWMSNPDTLLFKNAVYENFSKSVIACPPSHWIIVSEAFAADIDPNAVNIKVDSSIAANFLGLRLNIKE